MCSLSVVIGLALLCMPVYAQEVNEKKQKIIVAHNNVGRVLCALAATVYRHPFMTCFSLYKTLFPSRTIRVHCGVRAEISDSRGLFTGLVDAMLLCDVAHNILHAYRIRHKPCGR